MSQKKILLERKRLLNFTYNNKNSIFGEWWDQKYIKDWNNKEYIIGCYNITTILNLLPTEIYDIIKKIYAEITSIIQIIYKDNKRILNIIQTNLIKNSSFNKISYTSINAFKVSSMFGINYIRHMFNINKKIKDICNLNCRNTYILIINTNLDEEHYNKLIHTAYFRIKIHYMYYKKDPTIEKFISLDRSGYTQLNWAKDIRVYYFYQINSKWKLKYLWTKKVCNELINTLPL